MVVITRFDGFPRFAALAIAVVTVAGSACSYPVSDFEVAGDDGSTFDQGLGDASIDVSLESGGSDTTNDSTITDSTAIDSTPAIDSARIDSTPAIDSRPPPPVDTGVDTAPSCPTGTLTCGVPSKCRATHDDPLSCTASTTTCGGSCSASQYCKNGGCACRPGLVSCGGGACVDIAGDETQCGGDCSKIDNCTGFAMCDGGKCKFGLCGGGRTKCGNSCFDIANDANHCGGCTAAPCQPNEVCLAGACKRYEIAISCAAKGGCDCGSILAGSVVCDPFSGTTGSHPICVIGTMCPGGPWK